MAENVITLLVKNGMVQVFTGFTRPGKTVTFDNQANAKDVNILIPETKLFGTQKIIVPAGSAEAQTVQEGAYGDYTFTALSGDTKQSGIIAVAHTLTGIDINFIFTGEGQARITVKAKKGETSTFITSPPGTVLVEFETTNPLSQGGVPLPPTFDVTHSRTVDVTGAPGIYPFKASLEGDVSSDQTGGTENGDFIIDE